MRIKMQRKGTTKNKELKKAQMKIQQMAFMLVAVLVFFVMVGLFLLKIRLGGLEETGSELEQENAILLASKLANSPEFACGEAFGSKRSNCVDFDKVMFLKNNIDKYAEFWGVNNIELKITYSVGGYRRDCTMENYPHCDRIVLVEGPITGYDVSTFVTVCRKETLGENVQDVCNLGKLFVRYGDEE